MKRKKGSSGVKRARSTAAHRRGAHGRPLHKRVLLHPISAFLLLCVGVLVAGSTFRSQAVSYDVTATVAAPSLTSPAVISNPANQQHVTEEVVPVSGTCPNSSYVKLYRNGEFAGTAICEGGGFNIQTTLSLGANELQARVFNFTDNEGPVSGVVTVYYDLPVAPPASPPAVPTTLEISGVEQESYQEGVVQEVAGHPTISGFAPPFSDITVTFFSEPSVCKTKADAAGFWRCTLPHALPPGLHSVVVVAVTPSGKKLTFPRFQVAVKEYVEPFFITSDYKFEAHQVGQSYGWKLAIKGGTPPYQLTIDWGDGQTSHVDRSDGSVFTLVHTYDSPSNAEQNYTIIITALDARGATTVLQLTAVVKSSIAPLNNSRDVFGGLMNNVQRWLWVIWPAYLIVLLMAVSFWIGEREAFQRFRAKGRLGRPHRGRR